MCVCVCVCVYASVCVRVCVCVCVWGGGVHRLKRPLRAFYIQVERSTYITIYKMQFITMISREKYCNYILYSC